MRGLSDCVTDNLKSGRAACSVGNPGVLLVSLCIAGLPLWPVSAVDSRGLCLRACLLHPPLRLQNHPGLAGEVVGERGGEWQGSERGTSV